MGERFTHSTRSNLPFGAKENDTMHPDITRTMRACRAFGNNDTNSPAFRAGQAIKARAEAEYQSWFTPTQLPQGKGATSWHTHFTTR